MHGSELVEELGSPELQAGLEQFGAYAQRENAADEEHGQAEQQVQRADIFVVGGGNPAHDSRGRTVVMVVVRCVVVVVGVIGCHDALLKALYELRAALTCAWP
jgi:hypothetical protein